MATKTQPEHSTTEIAGVLIAMAEAIEADSFLWDRKIRWISDAMVMCCSTTPTLYRATRDALEAFLDDNDDYPKPRRPTSVCPQCGDVHNKVEYQHTPGLLIEDMTTMLRDCAQWVSNP